MAGTLVKAALTVAVLAAGVAVVLREEVSGIFATGPCSGDIAALPRNPVEAADHALAGGDRRVLGVAGYGIAMPGVAGYPEPDDYRVLRNTSDTPEDLSCMRYQEKALAYAERYNRRILERTGRGAQAAR